MCVRVHTPIEWGPCVCFTRVWGYMYVCVCVCVCVWMCVRTDSNYCYYYYFYYLSIRIVVTTFFPFLPGLSLSRALTRNHLSLFLGTSVALWPQEIMRLNPGWQVTYIYLLFYVRDVLQKRMVKLMTWSFKLQKGPSTMQLHVRLLCVSHFGRLAWHLRCHRGGWSVRAVFGFLPDR